MHDVAWRGMWICVRSKDAQKQLARTSLIEAHFCHEVSFMLFWMLTVSSRSPVQWFYIILASKISTQRLHESLRQLPGLAEENVVIFDGFVDNLAKKNDSLIHYLLSNPACELIVQLSL